MVLGGALPGPALGAPKPPGPPQLLPASSWILVDPLSGDVLAAQSEKTALPVASATKLMTYYVSREKLRPDREVVVAPYDAAPGESLAGLEAGDSLLARDLFFGLLVPSGNDAAESLALATSGSEADFVTRMNVSADKLGLSESDFVDPIGISSGNVSSARDLVDLAIELREDSLFRDIVDTPRITLRPGAEPLLLENRNTLVLEEPFIDGVKTGTTLEAGYVLVGSGERRGVELVSAVLGSPDAESRDSATLELLDYGFSLYRKRTLVERGEIVGSVALEGSSGRLSLEAASAVVETAREDQRVEFDLKGLATLMGPLAKGESLGSAGVVLDGREVAEVDVLAVRAVAPPPAPADDGDLPSWAWLTFAGAGLVAAALAGTAIAIARRPER